MSRCACGNPRPPRKCCAPILSGAHPAPDPESLVRARYSAFVAGDMDFLLRTTHAKTMCRFQVDENRRWSEQADWLGLDIVATRRPTDGIERDDEETVMIEFRARYMADGLQREHREVSELRHSDGEWRFYDGVPAPPKP